MGSYNKLDLVGSVFGDLTVQKFAYTNKNRKTVWFCQCKCGNTKEVLGVVLKRGDTKSCGCRKRNSNTTWCGHGDVSGTYWNDLKHGAIRRNIEFSVSIEEAWDIFLKQDKKCTLSGVELFLAKKYADRRKQTASLDRINSKKGYVSSNIQWVHKVVNQMKWDMAQTDLIEWCKRIYTTNDMEVKNEFVDCRGVRS